MEPGDQRNMLLALVLCFGLLMGYQYFIAGPQAKAAEEARKRSTAQVVATTPSQTFQIKSRNEVVDGEIAAGARVPFDAPAIHGTISLKGGRIDDVSL